MSPPLPHRRWEAARGHKARGGGPVHELLIVGGGPAGMTAAVYAARKKLDTVLVSHDLGGQVNWTSGVENYMGYQYVTGPELMKKFQEQMEQFPIEQRVGTTVETIERADGGFRAAIGKDGSVEARTVIVATGKRPRRLGVPGEMKLIGRGVTYCATCDGPLFAGEKVLVVGGGNSALSAALDMVKIADHVYLVSLTPLTGDVVLADQLREATNVTVLTEHEIVRVEGEDLVTGAAVRDARTGEEKRLEAGGVFVEIGLVPNADPVKDLVALNEGGEIIVDCECRTNVAGVFAAGDVTDVPEKQIVIAAGEGAKAALQAHRYLQHHVRPDKQANG
jgi:alkyl hydroperoxide reductase subunit F